MKWLEFIFSDKRRTRIFRHTLFWAIWWLYFVMCFYLYNLPAPGRSHQLIYVTTGSFIVLNTFLLLILYAFATYTFVYFLLPQMLKGKWWKSIGNTVLLGIFLITAAYFMYWKLFPIVDALFGQTKATKISTNLWPAINLGLVTSIKVVASAAIIKYIKYWWLKQKENEKIKQEKVITELQLLKAQVQPDFLFKTLNNIYTYSLAASSKAPGMLLKLSDILSYMLYECDQSLVPLDKEIAMVKDYMTLEKIRLGDSLEMELTVIGDATDKMIAPFLLLPFIENSFDQSSQMPENSWINLDISIDKHLFHMKLANGRVPGKNNQPDIPVNGLGDVQKRLTLLYPQQHELKIAGEQEMLIVQLKIQLGDATAPPTEKHETLLDMARAQGQTTAYAT